MDLKVVFRVTDGEHGVCSFDEEDELNRHLEEDELNRHLDPNDLAWFNLEDGEECVVLPDLHQAGFQPGDPIELTFTSWEEGFEYLIAITRPGETEPLWKQPDLSDLLAAAG